MQKLIVIVSRLNKRKIIPVRLPDQESIAGVVMKGFTFEGEEVIDVPNPALGKWYKDRDGYFYWGEGVNEVNTASQTNQSPAERNFHYDINKMSWGHKLYDIPLIWNDLKTKGTGAVIAIIDTGVDESHLDLIPNILPNSKSLIGNPDDIMDKHGHGTRMAGIIAGTGGHQVYGIAPEAKILMVKATPKQYEADINIFTEAVKYITSIPEVDIVSISYTFNEDPRFSKAIQDCLNANKIVVASMGNLRNADLPEDIDTYPACYNTGQNNTGKKEVLAIGAFDSQKNLCSFSNWNRHLSFLAPGDAILTTNIGNSTIKTPGTSVAAAFTAGCLALMVSYGKLKNKGPVSYPDILLKTCDDFGPEIGFDVKSGFGIMNFRNAISKIK